jgi:hypothetical protein
VEGLMAEKDDKKNDSKPAGDDEGVTAIAIPTDIAGWSDLDEDGRVALLGSVFDGVEPDDLKGIRADVVAEIKALAEDRNPDTIARMEELGDYLEVIDAERGRRAEAQKALDDAADAVLNKVKAGDEQAKPDGEADQGGDAGGDGGEGGPAGVEPIAGAEGAGEGGDGNGGAAAPAGAPVPVGAGQAATRTGPKPSGSGLAQRMQQIHDAAGAGTTAAVATLEPGQTFNADQLAIDLLGVIETPAGFTALKEAKTEWFEDQDLTVGDAISMEQLAAVIWGKYNALEGKHGEGVHDDWLRVARAKIEFTDERKLKEKDVDHNFAVITKLRQNVETIVASGGTCAPAAPRYEVNQYAMPQSPIEDALMVMGAPRGAVTVVKALDWTQMRSAVGVTTDTQDIAMLGEAPDGTDASGSAGLFKPCFHPTCPSPVTTKVVAVSTCVQFGNLTYETWPEFVAARLKDLAANFASVKEVFYLDKIDADATLSQETNVGYGLYRALVHHVAKEAHNYRKRQNMDVDATLDWFAPDWLVPATQIDVISDAFNGADHDAPAITSAWVTQQFAAFGLNVVWYYDSATGASQAFNSAITAQVGSADNANQFPTSATWYLEAPGTHARLDAGQLDLGIVRDSVLNRTNDLSIFAEQFLQVVMVGAQTMKGVTKGLCPSGAAPTTVAVRVCT